MNELPVERADAGKRLDIFLASARTELSRSRWQQLIRGGFVRLNGAAPRPREVVRAGDRVEWEEPAPEPIEAHPEAISLEILFEDNDLIVLNKTAGMVVHPGAGNAEHTLVNALLAHCPNLSGIGGRERPGIVHRLDKETSGCLVIAKNDATHRHLSKQFAARTVRKIYLALVAGRLRKPAGRIDAPIARHPIHRQRMSVARAAGGRAAVTEYRVVRAGKEMSLVECVLHSGRTHQIRVHLHHLGHPVLGDKIYGAKKAADFPRQMLHAWQLGFVHPSSQEALAFTAPPPADFTAALAHIEAS